MDVVLVSDLNKNFSRSTDLAEKRHGSPDLHTPIHPPQYRKYERNRFFGCVRDFDDHIILIFTDNDS